MFPTTPTPTPRRSVRDAMRGAFGTALEFATLGEATLTDRPASTVAPHPHRRPLTRTIRPRRDGAVRARACVCTQPVE